MKKERAEKMEKSYSKPVLLLILYPALFLCIVNKLADCFSASFNFLQSSVQISKYCLFLICNEDYHILLFDSQYILVYCIGAECLLCECSVITERSFLVYCHHGAYIVFFCHLRWH